MAIHFHPHPHSPHQVRRFALEHPYATDQVVLILVTLAAILVWLLNS